MNRDEIVELDKDELVELLGFENWYELSDEYGDMSLKEIMVEVAYLQPDEPHLYDLAERIFFLLLQDDVRAWNQSIEDEGDNDGWN